MKISLVYIIELNNPFKILNSFPKKISIKAEKFNSQINEQTPSNKIRGKRSSEYTVRCLIETRFWGNQLLFHFLNLYVEKITLADDDKFIPKYPKLTISMFRDWAARKVSCFLSYKNKFREIWGVCDNI